ncbi:YhgE/Pip domain-containing protein, partial [Dermabacteraceae bacterium P13101]
MKTWRSLLVAFTITALLAVVAMASLSPRTNTLQEIPAAVVNLDEGTTLTVDGKEQFVPFGRQLTAALTQPEDNSADSFNWTIATDKEARKGLADGRFLAVVIIPKDFSQRLGTLGTPQAQRAEVQVLTRDSDGPIPGLVAPVIARATTGEVGDDLTKRYLSRLYLGFGEMKEGLQQAAHGAGELANGQNELAHGLQQAKDGSKTLASGLSEAGDGARRLAEGNQQAAAGGQKLAAGNHQAADGAQRLAEGTGQIAQGQQELVAGSKQLADGTQQLSAGAKQTADGQQQLASGLAGAADGAQQLAQQTPAL